MAYQLEGSIDFIKEKIPTQNPDKSEFNSVFLSQNSTKSLEKAGFFESENVSSVDPVKYLQEFGVEGQNALDILNSKVEGRLAKHDYFVQTQLPIKIKTALQGLNGDLLRMLGQPLPIENPPKNILEAGKQALSWSKDLVSNTFTKPKQAINQLSNVGSDILKSAGGVGNAVVDAKLALFQAKSVSTAMKGAENTVLNKLGLIDGAKNLISGLSGEVVETIESKSENYKRFLLSDIYPTLEKQVLKSNSQHLKILDPEHRQAYEEWLKTELKNKLVEISNEISRSFIIESAALQNDPSSDTLASQMADAEISKSAAELNQVILDGAIAIAASGVSIMSSAWQMSSAVKGATTWLSLRVPGAMGTYLNNLKRSESLEVQKLITVDKIESENKEALFVQLDKMNVQVENLMSVNSGLDDDTYNSLQTVLLRYLAVDGLGANEKSKIAKTISIAKRMQKLYHSGVNTIQAQQITELQNTISETSTIQLPTRQLSEISSEARANIVNNGTVKNLQNQAKFSAALSALGAVAMYTVSDLFVSTGQAVGAEEKLTPKNLGTQNVSTVFTSEDVSSWQNNVGAAKDINPNISELVLDKFADDPEKVAAFERATNRFEVELNSQIQIKAEALFNDPSSKFTDIEQAYEKAREEVSKGMGLDPALSYQSPALAIDRAAEAGKVPKPFVEILEKEGFLEKSNEAKPSANVVSSPNVDKVNTNSVEKIGVSKDAKVDVLKPGDSGQPFIKQEPSVSKEASLLRQQALDIINNQPYIPPIEPVPAGISVASTIFGLGLNFTGATNHIAAGTVTALSGLRIKLPDRNNLDKKFKNFNSWLKNNVQGSWDEILKGVHNWRNDQESSKDKRVYNIPNLTAADEPDLIKQIGVLSAGLLSDQGFNDNFSQSGEDNVERYIQSVGDRLACIRYFLSGESRVNVKKLNPDNYDIYLDNIGTLINKISHEIFQKSDKLANSHPQDQLNKLSVCLESFIVDGGLERENVNNLQLEDLKETKQISNLTDWVYFKKDFNNNEIKDLKSCIVTLIKSANFSDNFEKFKGDNLYNELLAEKAFLLDLESKFDKLDSDIESQETINFVHLNVEYIFTKDKMKDLVATLKLKMKNGLQQIQEEINTYYQPKPVKLNNVILGKLIASGKRSELYSNQNSDEYTELVDHINQILEQPTTSFLFTNTENAGLFINLLSEFCLEMKKMTPPMEPEIKFVEKVLIPKIQERIDALQHTS